MAQYHITLKSELFTKDSRDQAFSKLLEGILNQDKAAKRALWYRFDIVTEEFTHFFGVDIFAITAVSSESSSLETSK